MKMLGSWRVGRCLGRGGMGIVFRATHIETGEPAALKTLRAESQSRRTALLREVDALAALQHPHVVDIVDHGSSDGTPWYVMALHDGMSLRAMLNHDITPSPFDRDLDHDTRRWWTATQAPSNPPITLPSTTRTGGDAARPSASRGRGLEARAATRICRDVARALAYMHAAGVMHRDLKPDNVLLDESGRAIVVDFGLASWTLDARARERLDGLQGPAGTVRYMAPEVIRGAASDPRSDLYSLGCMLFELLTGRAPFTGPAPAVREKHLHAPPPELGEDADEELGAFVQSLLAKHVEDRPAFAEIAVARLDAMLGERSSETPRLVRLHTPTFTGREVVLTQLEERLCEGGVVALVASAGQGKTRVLNEWVRRLRTTVLSEDAGRPHIVACNAELARPPRTALGAHFPTLAPLCDLLVDTVGELEPDAMDRLALHERLEDALDDATRRAPWIVLIDDAHRGDPASLRLLAFLARVASERERGWLLVPSWRPDEAPRQLTKLVDDAVCETLTLPALDDASVTTMVQSMLGGAAPAGLVRFLAERAEGHPIVVAEYLRSAVAAGWLQLEPGSGRWRVDVDDPLGHPESGVSWRDLAVPGLRSVIQARLQRLGPEHRRVLEAAAVLGRAPERDVVRELVSELAAVDITTAEHACIRLELLEPVGMSAGMRFYHDMIRETVLETLEPETRSSLHARAASLLEARDVAPLRLAGHLASAGEVRRAHELYRIEAEDALADEQFERAAAAFEAAVECRDPADVPAELFARALRAELMAGRIQDGLRLAGVATSHLEPDLPARFHRLHAELLAHAGRLDEALERLATPGADTAEPAHLLARARLLLKSGAASEAAETCRDALGRLRGNPNDTDPVLRAADETDRRLEAQILATFCQTLWRRSQDAEAATILDSLIEDCVERSDRHGEMAARLERAVICSRYSNRDEEFGHTERALEIAREVGARAAEGKALGYLGNACLMDKRTREAIEYYEAALALERRLGSGYDAVTVLANLSTAYGRSRQLEKSESLKRIAIARKRAQGDRRAVAVLHANLARHLMRMGRLDEAREAVEIGRAEARAIGDDTLDVWLAEDLVAIAKLECRWSSALDQIDECIARRRALGTRPELLNYALNHRAQCLVHVGRFDEARRDCERALAWFETADDPQGITMVLTTSAMLLLHEDAESSRAEVLRIRERIERTRQSAELPWLVSTDVEKLDELIAERLHTPR